MFAGARDRAPRAAVTFHHCDDGMYRRLWAWAQRRHPLKSRHWIARRYWTIQPGARWDFVAKREGTLVPRLRRHTDTHIRRHIQVRGRASPYDGNLRYRATRLTHHPLTGTILGRLLAAQQGRCTLCGLTFLDDDALEIDHILPLSQGGHAWCDNRQVIHRHCHDQKTARDVRVSIRDKDRMAEEPDTVKALRPVLQGGGHR